MTMHGIDISHWQTGLNVAATDAQFVIIKVTDGTGYIDPQAVNFAHQIINAGRLGGAYHFYEGAGVDVARREADHFLEQVAPVIGRALLALDFEHSTTDVAGAHAWLDRVYDRTGVRPLIYMSQSLTNAHDWSAVARDYGLWVARYNDTIGPTGAWSDVTMWQYTDAHKTGGFTVDGDRFYGNADAWHRLAGNTTPDPEDEDDMATRTYVQRDITTDQDIAADSAWHTIKVNGDPDTKSPAAILSGPADIIGGEYNVSVDGLKSGEAVLMRVFAADTDPDGPDPRRSTGWVTRLIPPDSGGTARASAPLVWDLGGPSKGHSSRNLRIEVKILGSGGTRTVSEAHAKLWYLEP